MSETIVQEEAVRPQADGPDDDSADRCRNCEAVLAGSYCSECGQKARNLHVGIHEFLHDAVHEFLHFDGKIFRTLKILVMRPGELTRDFIEGRRVSQISPIRLYLIWSALFFTLFIVFDRDSKVLTIKTGGQQENQSLTASEEHGSEAGSFEARLEQGSRKIDQNPELLGHALGNGLPKAMFALMPFFALLLFFLYRSREPFYIPHLYFSIHYHSFVFLLLSCTTLLSVSHVRILGQLGDILHLGLFVYLYLALRRFYQTSRLGTLARMAILSVVYLLSVLAAMVSVVFYRVLTLH